MEKNRRLQNPEAYERKKKYMIEYHKEHKEKNNKKDKLYYEANKIKIAERKRKHYLEHKAEVNKRTAAYYENNKDKLKEDSRLYRSTHQEEHKEYCRVNREKLNKKHRDYINKNPQARIKDNVSRLVRSKLKNHNGFKDSYLKNMLPYTMNELMLRLESMFQPGMSWDNYGKWHIDHIIPDSSFIYTSYMDDGFKQSWALTNLQPLWAHDNQVKSNKM